MNAYEFIIKNIDKTTKLSNDCSNKETLINLPFPYTTPCIKDTFQEMYYWDTYFTQKCLYLTGKKEQAKNNILNFCFLLEKYGKIPNGNRTFYLTRSQPPFFGMMIEDLMKFDKNIIPAEKLYKYLKIEYDFWQNNRKTTSGLNGYNCDENEQECLDNIEYVTLYTNRTGIPLKKTAENSRHVQAECESGWDFTPRYMSRCADFNPVDLNSLLYRDELILSRLSKEIGDANACEKYSDNAKNRAKNMKIMLKNGIYYDYNYKTHTHSNVISCAGLFPYFTGVDDNQDHLKQIVNQLERQYGMIACLHDQQGFQWSQPNSWAPLNYIAVKALFNLQLFDDAKRIADKYLNATDKIFMQTHRLWEKYNGISGDLNVSSEYGTPEMLGWTAGVYMALYHYKKSGYKILI